MKKLITFLFLGIILVYTGFGISQAQEPATKQIQTNISENSDDDLSLNLGTKESSEINYLSMISSLLTVILIILVCAWIYKKFIGVSAEKLLSGKIKEAKENAISVLTTTPIGQNKYLHLVEVKNQKFLIGSTSNDIVMLKEIAESDKSTKGDVK